MIDIARFGHPDHRMQQQDPIELISGALGELLVDSMERVAGLESDDIAVAHMRQLLPRLRRRETDFFEIEVPRQLENL